MVRFLQLGLSAWVLAVLPVAGVRAAPSGFIARWGPGVNPPPGDDFIAMSVSTSGMVALREDGSLAASRMGLDDRFGFLDVPAGSDFVSISVGGGYALALKSDGSIAAWGLNLTGACDVPEGHYTAVAAGSYHGVALRSDGSLAAWGSDDDRIVVPEGNDFTAIAAGGYHSVALRNDGSLVAWGLFNTHNQLDVPDGTDYVAISAGGSHSLALRADGSVVGWGWDEYGQASVPDGGPYVFTAIAGGGGHSAGLLADGSVLAWGSTGWGSPHSGVPSPPPAGMKYIAVAAGDGAVYALVPEPSMMALLSAGSLLGLRATRRQRRA